jgi:hypothetical protein
MAAKPYVALISVNGKTTYFGSFATKEEADARKIEARKENPTPKRTGFRPNSGAKKGVKLHKVKCPICSNQITIHRVSAHYKLCKSRRKK